MDVNNSVWDNYKPGYVDPMYVPYQKHRVPGIRFPVNTWNSQGPTSQVAPALTRIDWGMSFQKKHNTFPCPRGFTGGNGSVAKETGWCYASQPEFTPVFYTNDWPGGVNPYELGYTTGRHVPKMINEGNVNPATGGYSINKYWVGAPSNRGVAPQYGAYPVRHSYLVDA